MARNSLFGRKQHHDQAQRRFLMWTVIPLVLYMAFWTLFPLIWGFALAFFEYSARRAGGPFLGLGGDNPFIGLQNFEAMLDFSPDAPLKVRQFHNGVKTTLLFAFLVVPLNLAITLPLAVLIEIVYARLKALFRTVFFLPVLAPSVGVAIMWGYVFHPQRGLVNGILTGIFGRLIAINWTGDQSLVIAGVPVALLPSSSPISGRTWATTWSSSSPPCRASPRASKTRRSIDGVNGWQMFSHITLPLLRPTILLAAILTMISAFQVFDIIQVMTDGGPNDQTRVLVIDIYNNAFRFQQMGWASAVSMVLFLLVLIISLVQSRLLESEWEY